MDRRKPGRKKPKFQRGIKVCALKDNESGYLREERKKCGDGGEGQSIGRLLPAGPGGNVRRPDLTNHLFLLHRARGGA